MFILFLINNFILPIFASIIYTGPDGSVEIDSPTNQFNGPYANNTDGFFQ